MAMRVIVTNFLESGTCELSNKSGVECVEVAFDATTPAAIVSTAELIKMLRFRKKQESKNGIALPIARSAGDH